MGATLYDVLHTLQYDAKISVWIDTGYSQYIPVFEGQRDKGVYDDEYEMFWHATDKVSLITVHGGWLVIFIDDGEQKRAEERYPSAYVKHWKMDDPSTRPFLYGAEMMVREHEMDEQGYV